MVVARGGDAPPAVTQMALSRPLETALATVLGVERIRSRTIRGAVEISLQFAPGTDMWRALQLVESRVGDTRSALPASAEVQVERLTTTSFPVVTFNVTGKVDPRRLRDLGELVLRPAISRVRGVGRVEVLGGDVREVEVILDPARTAALKLSPGKIAEKVRASTVLQSVGRYEDTHSLVTVVASGEAMNVDDVAALAVAVGADGSPIPLSAIATVVEGAEDRLLRVSGPGGETVLVSVSRLPGASTPDVVARVQEAVRQATASFPAGVSVTPVYDQAALVDEAMRSVRDAILLGIALCVAVIALFLRDLRSGLVAALAVPLTLGMTFVPLGLLGQSLNLMSMGGLCVAIGLVIDDAIVVVEATRRRLENGAAARGRGARRRARAVRGAGRHDDHDRDRLPAARLAGRRRRALLRRARDHARVGGADLARGRGDGRSAGGDRRDARAPAAPPPAPPWYARAYARAIRPVLRRPLARAGRRAGAAGGGRGRHAVRRHRLSAQHGRGRVRARLLPAGRHVARPTPTPPRARSKPSCRRSRRSQTYARRTGAELGPVAATEVSRGDIMVGSSPRRPATGRPTT